MTSLISTLSILILIFANFCFPIPVDEEISSSTLSTIHDDLTTNKIATLRLVPDDETASLPNLKPEQLLKEHKNDEMLTSTDRISQDAARALRAFDEISNSEAMTSTIQSTTEVQQGGNVHLEHGNESGIQITVELTTINTPSLTSTSSVISPELYTTQATSLTQKYIGHLNDEIDEEEPIPHKTSPKKTKAKKAKSGEKVKIPIALYDQGALGKVSNYPKEYMMLDENNDLVVTLPPETSPTATLEHKVQQNQKPIQHPKPLEQGQKPSHIEEKESSH